VRLRRIAIAAAVVTVLSASFIRAQAPPLGASSPAAAAQATPEPQMQFEVASIKLSGPKSEWMKEGGPETDSPRLFRYHHATLLGMITVAWKVDSFQVSSAEPLDKETFDLDARVPEGKSREQFRTMLKNLLTDRFGLRVHMESREFAAYELVVAKSGLKLKQDVPGSSAPIAKKSPQPFGDIGWPDLPPGQPDMAVQESMDSGLMLVRARVQLKPLSALVNMLPRLDRLPVVDKTGLTGTYSYTLEYTQEIEGTTPDGPAVAPDLFTAIREQLGLQLIRAKHFFDVVAVDAFQKMPSEN
jgi:uncharacterized protein (TIGR03435 family)